MLSAARDERIAQRGAIDGEDAAIEDVPPDLLLPELEPAENAELVVEGIIADKVAAVDAGCERIGDAEVRGELSAAER